MRKGFEWSWRRKKTLTIITVIMLNMLQMACDWSEPAVNAPYMPQLKRAMYSINLFFLVVYSCVVALRVSAISFTKSCDPGRTRDEIIPLLLPIGMIVLASALHRGPLHRGSNFLLIKENLFFYSRAQRILSYHLI